jgi:hypothetical protein
MSALPSLYKARNLPLKRPVCAICIDRTRGRTEEIRLGYRVSVWLCPGHASQASQTKRGGRDFVRTLMGVWQANGCLTAARHRALDAHLSQLRARPPHRRPGSYAWPDLRRRLEARYAQGAPPPNPHTSARARPTPPTPPAAAPSSAGTPNDAGSTTRPNRAGTGYQRPGTRRAVDRA